MLPIETLASNRNVRVHDCIDLIRSAYGAPLIPWSVYLDEDHNIATFVFSRGSRWYGCRKSFFVVRYSSPATGFMLLQPNRREISGRTLLNTEKKIIPLTNIYLLGGWIKSTERGWILCVTEAGKHCLQFRSVKVLYLQNFFLCRRMRFLTGNGFFG